MMREVRIPFAYLHLDRTTIRARASHQEAILHPPSPLRCVQNGIRGMAWLG